METDMRLPSWRPGRTRTALLDFIDAADAVPVDDRVAVFDNDGTLWCEKPAYPQLLFMLDELGRAIAADPSLAEREEYRAMIDHDRAAQAEIGLERIAFALLELRTGIGPEEFDDRVAAFFERSRHPDRGVAYAEMRYRPMLELLDELRAHDFDVFIVTGGGAEFVRAISRPFYAVSPDAVVGSLVGYEFARDDAGRPMLRRTTQLFGEVNEGAPKVTNIQLQLGRRPIFAAGNSPGDAEMLEYALAADGPSMALLVNHDDADREYEYEGEAGTFETDGSFTELAEGLGITIASMRNDWETVF
ncbi:MAG: haloacid dehalogenase-like hydrolase [Acidimicrobiales bacterium]|nr:MAG: haloacid dehalogenase-like hydrolase [Acidimicrobiales bacterium]